MKKGFTFIELVLLVLCVTAIGAIIAPKTSEILDRAWQNSCRDNMLTLATAETMYFSKFNRYGTIANLEATGILENATEIKCPSSGAGGSAYCYGNCGGVYTIACPYLPGAATGDHGSVNANCPNW